MTTSYHQPALVAESLRFLDLKPGSVVVDGTLGGGGHSRAILEATAPNGQLIGLDVDPDALAEAEGVLDEFGDRVHLVHASFRRMKDAVSNASFDHVDGVLLDLGVSSYQLDQSSRGFRFTGPDPAQTPLDMRLGGESSKTTAADLLRTRSAEDLQLIFQRYGELPGAKRLAERIVAERNDHPLLTSADLIEVIDAAGIGGGRRHNRATLVFQALRIAVNDELEALEDGLSAAIDVLGPGGRLVVISYHSLEDRIVKHRLRAEMKGCSCPPDIPVCICGGESRLRLLTKRPVSASEEERSHNPRSRSARLRAAERVGRAA